MKKGFTLVELLAVIIILGVLSLLIVPKVINTLNDSEEKTNMASAEGLLKAAEYKYQDNEIKGISESIKVDYTNNINIDKLDFNGKKPEKGEVKINKNGKVSMAVKIGNKCYLKAVQDKEITTTDYDATTCVMPKLITLVEDADENGQISSGDEYAIGDEHFYIISVNNNIATMLAKYNLNVGNIMTECNEENDYECNKTPIPTTTPGYGLQSEDVTGWSEELEPTTYKGTIEFSTEPYWRSDDSWHLKTNYGDTYPTYVYDSNSSLYEYIENYVSYLKELGVPDTTTGRLINLNDLTALGCDYVHLTCSDITKTWLYSTAYWTGIVDIRYIFSFRPTYEGISEEQIMDSWNYDLDEMMGIRPVIEIDLSEF